jgi:hypothetical protein
VAAWLGLSPLLSRKEKIYVKLFLLLLNLAVYLLVLIDLFVVQEVLLCVFVQLLVVVEQLLVIVVYLLSVVELLLIDLLKYLLDFEEEHELEVLHWKKNRCQTKLIGYRGTLRDLLEFRTSTQNHFKVS